MSWKSLKLRDSAELKGTVLGAMFYKGMLTDMSKSPLNHSTSIYIDLIIKEFFTVFIRCLLKYTSSLKEIQIKFLLCMRSHYISISISYISNEIFYGH